MDSSTMINFPMLILQSVNLTEIIWYISIFALFIILGYIWYLLFHSHRKEIQLQVSIYPFFQSAGRIAEGRITHSSNTNDTSSLYSYIINIDQLTQKEFEEMVVETFNHKGWTSIETTSRDNDKGWEITGLDENKRLTYVRVKYSSKKVENSIVQKFQSTKMTGRAQRSIIITNSKFTDEALEYAREVNIELIEGQKFKNMCQRVIEGAPRSDKLTRPINLASLELEFHEFIDRAMYSYPNPASTFISKIQPSKITFSPYEYYQFKLWEQFVSSNRSWIWDMKYSDHILVNHPTQKWQVIENRQQSQSTDLDKLTEILEKEGCRISIIPSPQINKQSTVKEIIQQVTTTEKSYKDENNQKISKICTAKISNINVQSSTIFWGSSVDLKAKIGDDTEIKFQLHEGKVSKDLSQNKVESLLNKTTIVCQDCNSIAKPAKFFRNLNYCLACGKVLCNSCGHTEVKLIALKSQWCSECWSQIKTGEKEMKKNKEALKKLKISFQDWQIR